MQQSRSAGIQACSRNITVNSYNWTPKKSLAAQQVDSGRARNWVQRRLAGGSISMHYWNLNNSSAVMDGQRWLFASVQFNKQQHSMYAFAKHTGELYACT